MNLSELIDRLSSEDPALVLPRGWESPHSYRGYYECLAFEPKDDVTVADCLAAASEAYGNTYNGWKGGYFEMSGHTDCYLAIEGCIGDEITASWLDLNIELAKLKAAQS